MSELDYFVGTWRVEAKNPLTEREMVFLYSVHPAIGRTWYVGSADVSAVGLQMQDVWGRDPVTGEIVRSIFDSAGTYGTVRSKGWSGNILMLEGEARSSQGPMQVRETITRVDTDAFEAVWEALLEGRWTPYSVETLTRIVEK